MGAPLPLIASNPDLSKRKVNGTQGLNEAIEIFTASNLCACTNVTVASRKNLHTLYYRLFIELFWHFSGPKPKYMFERSLKLGIATYTEVI